MKKKILILGGTGMLGHKLYSILQRNYDAYATIRSSLREVEKFNIFNAENIFENVNVENLNSVIDVATKLKPMVLINCVGIIKQLKESNDPIKSIKINALLPHQLSILCEKLNIRLIHISTDCIFSGKRGNYLDEDISDAEDLYGRTKYLGEVSDKAHSVTLRTSIIGRELKTKLGLVEWFLSQHGQATGYKKAIFSGFTTFEFSRIISDYIIPNNALSGIYNISSEPISKYDLLNLIKDIYKKEINILPDEKIIIDRSLDSNKFRKTVNYSPPSWRDLINTMKLDDKTN